MIDNWLNTIFEAFEKNTYIGILVTFLLVIIGVLAIIKSRTDKYENDKDRASDKISESASSDTKKANDTTSDGEKWLNEE